MKVKELLELLEPLDKEAEVYMASDEEGNSFHKSHGLSKDSHIILWPSHEYLDI